MSKWLNTTTHNHQSCISHAIKQAEEICLQRNQRFTQVRRQVLEIIWQAHKPIGAYAVLEKLGASQGKHGVAPPTVYRALDFLLELGLVHRINSLNAYTGCLDPKIGHQGQFLICRHCSAVLELREPGIPKLIVQTATEQNFTVEQMVCEVLGVCPQCK
ncbi:Fur family transcriptional regulator [soil metagenome]